MANNRSESTLQSRHGARATLLRCILPILMLAIAACGQQPPADRDVSGAGTTLAPATVSVSATGPTGIDVGDPIKLSGSTSSNLRGATVHLQRLSDAGWTTIADARVSKRAAFVFSAPAEVEGRHQQFRVEAPKTSKTQQAVSTTVAISVFADPADRSYTFEDDFDQPALDRTKWGTRHQPRSDRRKCAQPSEDMVVVADGTARLKVRMRPNTRSKACPHGVWDNAMISTQQGSNPFSATYGVFAARIRFQSSRGMHGSFWLQGARVTGAEIDVAEYFGDGRADGGLTSFVHYTNAAGESQTSGGIRKLRGIVPAGDRLSQSWHVYSVEWDRTGYIFRIDGYPTLVTSEPHVASTPEILILSLLTSDWELPALKDPSGTMEVDWVRAWN